MEKEIFEKYIKAGEIATKVQELARKNAKPGKKLLELANEIEGKTIELGGEIAFPVNLSVNTQAAHYTPSFDDETVIGEKDVLKIDIGVHIDGYVCDCAFTVDFSGENTKLVEASSAALEAAVALAKPGVNVREIGKTIQTEIEKRGNGLKPVSNLCGHRVDQFHLHAGTSIPNVESGNYLLEEGDTFAIEPFATNGKGEVIDGDQTEIFLYTGEPVRGRLPATKKVGELIVEKYAELPFAQRWLHRDLPELQPFSINVALRELQLLNFLHPYPVLMEKGKGLVSQAETTIIVTKDGCINTTPIHRV